MIFGCKSHSVPFWRSVAASCPIHPSRPPLLGRSAPAANSPKKRGPDQCAPVIFLAILVRDGYPVPAYSNPSSVTVTVCVRPRHSLTRRAPGFRLRHGAGPTRPVVCKAFAIVCSLRRGALPRPPCAGLSAQRLQGGKPVFKLTAQYGLDA